MDTRRSACRPLSVEDGMIAAICLAHNASLATRNIRDFDGLGITLITPWTDPPTPHLSSIMRAAGVP